MKTKTVRMVRLGVLLLIIQLISLSFVSVNVNAVDWTEYQNTSTNNGVTENPGPADANHACFNWAVQMPGATTPPLIVGDRVYTACDKYVYCYDKNTGKELGKSDELKGRVGFALHPMVYADNRLYVTTENGGTSIEALDLSVPEAPKWQWASEPVTGTSYSPLTYEGGRLYTGTWSGESGGYYFCVDAGNGSVKWTMEDANGFYWDGAYATDTYVAFASENELGNNNEADGSRLYTVNATTGEIIDCLEDLKGSIRNTVVFDNGYLYVGTVAGRVYRVSVDSLGNLGEYSYIDLEGRIKATMIIDQGQLYVGVEGKGYDQSFYQVLDASKPFGQYSLIGRVNVPAEPKGAPVLSTAEDGVRHIYFTCNDGTGGLYHFTNKYESDELSGYDCLFMPESSMQEKCISSLALDSEGSIYYTNDSNNLMAVSSKIIEDVEISPSSGIQWKNQRFDSAVKNYYLSADDSVSRVSMNVKLQEEEDAEIICEYIVNGKSQGRDANVALAGDTTTVVLKVTRKAVTLQYRFIIEKISPGNTSLGLLYFGKNYYAGENLLPEIEPGRTEYSVDLRTVSAEDSYMWILPENRNAKIKVYAVENVKDGGTVLKSGDILYHIFQEKTGELKYDVVPSDASANTVIRVRVTSADGSRTSDYQISFIRTDEHVHSWNTGFTIDKRATMTADGSKSVHCTGCDARKDVTVIRKVSKVALTVTAYTYNGKIKCPAVTVKNSGGRSLVKGTDYTVTYSGGRKYVGKYSAKITFKGAYSGSKTLYFKINPPKTSLSSLTASGRGFTARWYKKTVQVSGYQIQYSRSSRFTSPKTVKITRNYITSKKVTKLLGKKRYYVRVRTYKMVNGVPFYSGWSGSKYITTKL